MRSLGWVPTQCDCYSYCNKKFGHEHMQREDSEDMGRSSGDKGRFFSFAATSQGTPRMTKTMATYQNLEKRQGMDSPSVLE